MMRSPHTIEPRVHVICVSLPKQIQNDQETRQFGLTMQQGTLRQFPTIMSGRVLFAWGTCHSCRWIPGEPTVAIVPKRCASSKRWQDRQSKDIYRREATVAGLKSRAAFKLIQVCFNAFDVIILPALCNEATSNIA